MNGQDLYEFAHNEATDPRWGGLSPHTRSAWDRAASYVTDLLARLQR